MHSPIEQFVDHVIYTFYIFSYPIHVTHSTISILLALLIIICGTHWYLKRTYIIPSTSEYILESIYLFIRSMLIQQAGEHALPYLPLICTLFPIILFSNLLGLVPGLFTATSQLAITLLLASTVFFSIILIGLYEHGIRFFKLFAPSTVSPLLWPLVIPIEVISFFTKHLSLAIRLAVNMIAGHIILKIFASFITMAHTLPLTISISLVVIPVLVLLILLETFVACIQAYIFTLLTCVYINDVMHLH